MSDEQIELYAAEQKLLNELISIENKERTPQLKEYRGAIKRQVARINKQLDYLET